MKRRLICAHTTSIIVLSAQIPKDFRATSSSQSSILRTGRLNSGKFLELEKTTRLLINSCRNALLALGASVDELRPAIRIRKQIGRAGIVVGQSVMIQAEYLVDHFIGLRTNDLPGRISFEPSQCSFDSLVEWDRSLEFRDKLLDLRIVKYRTLCLVSDEASG